MAIAPAGGDAPRWRRDGRELYYIAPDRKLMAVPVKTGSTFEPGIAVPLFDANVTGFSPTTSAPTAIPAEHGWRRRGADTVARHDRLELAGRAADAIGAAES